MEISIQGAYWGVLSGSTPLDEKGRKGAWEEGK